jgi:hypothetical protein
MRCSYRSVHAGILVVSSSGGDRDSTKDAEANVASRFACGWLTGFCVLVGRLWAEPARCTLQAAKAFDLHLIASLRYNYTPQQLIEFAESKW